MIQLLDMPDKRSRVFIVLYLLECIATTRRGQGREHLTLRRSNSFLCTNTMDTNNTLTKFT